jgi:hypothetical protein
LNSTHIKFGGWDQEGMADGEQMSVLATKNNKEWSTTFDNVNFAD